MSQRRQVPKSHRSDVHTDSLRLIVDKIKSFLNCNSPMPPKPRHSLLRWKAHQRKQWNSTRKAGMEPRLRGRTVGATAAEGTDVPVIGNAVAIYTSFILSAECGLSEVLQEQIAIRRGIPPDRDRITTQYPVRAAHRADRTHICRSSSAGGRIRSGDIRSGR